MCCSSRAWPVGSKRLDEGNGPAKIGTRAAAFVFAGLLSITAQAQPSRVEKGLKFAQAHCASCHAIGATGASLLGTAPPFRSLHFRYPVENLAEALAEGITTAHPAMPQFQLDVAQIEDLIAYLKSLE
jgi:mono/diheme cytochrome c family protein